MTTPSSFSFEAVHATEYNPSRPGVRIRPPLLLKNPSSRGFRFALRDKQGLDGRRRSLRCNRTMFTLRSSTDSGLTAEEENVSKESEAVSDGAGESQSDRIPVTEASVGMVLDGVVKSVISYGCFIDANYAVDIFVHVSELAPFFVSATENVVKKGDKVKVELIEVDDRLKGSLKKHNRFVDPNKKERGPQRERRGEQRGERREKKIYSTGDEYEGVVEKVVTGGALIKLSDGKSSYLPFEEIRVDDTKPEKGTPVEDLLKEEDEVSVRVLRIDRRGRVVVTMRNQEELEFERTSIVEGLRVTDDDEKESAILLAALKQAGIVQGMFSGENGVDEAIKEKKLETPPASSVESQAIKEPEPAIEEPEELEVVEEPEPEPVAEVDDKTEPEPVATAPSDIQLSEEKNDDLETPAIEEAEIVAEPVAEIAEAPVEEPEPVAEEPEEEPEQVEEATPEPVAEAPVEEAKQEEPEPVAEVPVEPEPVAEVAEAPTEEVVEKVEEPEPVAEVPVAESEGEDKSIQISAAEVKALREISGAGILDCKKALTECNGDKEAAMTWLRQKGMAGAAKRESKVAAEGVITSYVHMGSNLGILLEVNTETDFVARTDEFTTFADDVAMTIASNPDAICIKPDDYPPDELEKERQAEMESEEIQNKPEGIREKIVAGKLEKFKKNGSVLGTAFIQDQTKTIEEVLLEVSASLGEKIAIRRFVRYELGEGLEKKSTDFASEVESQIAAKKAEAAAKTEEAEEKPEEAEEKPAASISASAVKELREMTGAGIMDCKNALVECNGDLDKAAGYLRKKGLAGAAKKAGRIAAEGVICTYIHFGSKLGVMAEVNCETDFVARGEEFQDLADDIAMQIAACPDVDYVSMEDIPQSVVDREIEIEMAKDDLQEKPEDIRKKIAEGRVQKTLKTMCLLDQPSIKDTTKTIQEIVAEHIATIGENIKVRRFVRYVLGEGIEKEETSFADQVAEQMQKVA